jgi:hypothetical protein
MEKHNKYAVLGLKALKRAADRIAETARENGVQIPVWKDGRIVFEIPGKDTEPSAAADAEKAPRR